MRRHGAAPGSLPGAGVRWLLAAGLGLALLSGCDDSGTAEQEASGAAAQCRSQWQRLRASYDGRGVATLPSDLAARWQTLAAAASFQENTTASSCSVALGAMRATADQIDALTTRLRPYDLSWALTDRSPAVTEALGASSRGTPKLRRRMRSALAALERAAPAAAADMNAGWQTANTVDLDEPAQVHTLMSDMDFLARDSAPYGTGRAALARVDKLVRVSRR